MPSVTPGLLFLPWNSSLLGSVATIGCHSGYYPSMNVTAICERSNDSIVWNPNPAEYNCTGMAYLYNVV